MDFVKHWRLCVMMFLEYMVWGIWYIKLGSYLPHLGFSAGQTANIFAAFFLASLISPFIGGQIADRYMPSQIFMGIVHFVGGLLLLYMGAVQDYWVMLITMFFYCMLYVPTMPLTNAICFHHLQDTEKEFGGIRAWGTIGWIFAGLFLTFWWTYVSPFPGSWDAISADAAQKAQYVAVEGWLFTLAGVVSLIFGVFCFTLPNTPPSKDSANPWAFMGALQLLKDRNFFFFMLLCFVVSTELMFYYILTAPFLESSVVGIQPQNSPAIMTIFAQGAEVLTLFLLLPKILPKFGIRKTIAIGIIAWPIRYAIFSIGTPWWLVVLALTLHGVCYVFFFVVGQIYVDTIAPKDIRASAQSLFYIIVFGMGLLFGSYFVGWITEMFTTTINGVSVVDYHGLFLVPTVLTIVCAAAFLLFFKEPPKREEMEIRH